MNCEFHYYITYILAIRAGYNSEIAYKIAYSSQFVDDNDILYWHLEYKQLITQSINPFNLRNIAKKNIFLYFLFMPGENQNHVMRKDRKSHPLVTTANSYNAKQCLQNAIASENPYYIGVATHVYADTWAHQNFVGLFSDFNASRRFWGRMLPDLGHADFMHQPDIVNLNWQDDRLARPSISNNERFLKAASMIFSSYRLKLRPTCPQLAIHKEELLQNLIYCMEGNTESNRIERYQALAKFYGKKPMPKYKRNIWHKQVWQRNWQNSDWYNFQQAAKIHYNFAHKLLRTQLNYAKELLYY
jgi:hypothetical protein